nr:11636_t:CDS:2 [Entrophospora candida]
MNNSAFAKGNDLKRNHYASEVTLSLGSTTNRELEAPRGHRVRLLEPSNRTGERLSLFALISQVEVKEIRDFEGILLSRYPEYTLGIFVTSLKDGYSNPAIQRKETSEYKILLSNIYDLRQDLPAFIPKDSIIEARFVTIEEKLHSIEEKFKFFASKIRDGQNQMIDNQNQMMDNQNRIKSNQPKEVVACISSTVTPIRMNLGDFAGRLNVLEIVKVSVYSGTSGSSESWILS